MVKQNRVGKVSSQCLPLTRCGLPARDRKLILDALTREDSAAAIPRPGGTESAPSRRRARHHTQPPQDRVALNFPSSLRAKGVRLDPLPDDITMPLVNGDSIEVSVLHGQALDYTQALEVLHEYPDKDGVDVRTLLDSKTHGGLTYNDFLVLPGYIGRWLLDLCFDLPF